MPMDPGASKVVETRNDASEEISIPSNNLATGLLAGLESVESPPFPTALETIRNVFQDSGMLVTDKIGVAIQLVSPPELSTTPTALDALKRENAALRKYAGNSREREEAIAATSLKHLKTQEHRYEKLGSLYHKEKVENEHLRKTSKRLRNDLMRSYQAKKPFLPTFAESDDQKIWNFEENEKSIEINATQNNLDAAVVDNLEVGANMGQSEGLFPTGISSPTVSKTMCSCTAEKRFKSSNLNKSRREDFTKRRNRVQLFNEEKKNLYCGFCYRPKKL